MSFKTTARLFMVVCLLALIIRLADRAVEPARDRRERGTRLLDIRAEEVTGLVIERGDLRTRCTRREDSWLLQYPLEARADSGRIESILSGLEALPRLEVVTSREREARKLTIADYGLAQPRARLLVTTPLERRELLIGRRAPVGDNIYVKLAMEDEIVGTVPSFLDSIPESLEELRDRRLLPGEAGRTVRIELRKLDGGFIQLARSGSTWRIQQPLDVPAEGGRVESMLDALFQARVTRFVWDPPLPTQVEAAPAEVDVRHGTPVQTFGLANDEAAVRVHVWAGGDRVGRELILGKPVEGGDNLVYAKLRSLDSVFAVPASLLRTFSVTVNEIRTRNVFLTSASDVGYACLQEGDIKLVLARRGNSWMITEPVQWPADDDLVSDLVGKLCRLRVVEFVDEPATNALADSKFSLQIHLLAKEPALPAEAQVAVPEPETARQTPAGNRGRLRIADMDPASETVVAKFENESQRMRLLTAEILALGIRPSEPLLYRDRSILSLAPENIRRLHVKGPDFEEAVARDAAGRWTAESPPDGKVDQQAVSDILLAAAGVRAVWIESHNPDDLSAYGLENPAGSVTFGLTGEGGIQKSIKLGSGAGPVGVYAMVKGQDVVFVLPSDVAVLFSRRLTAPTPPRTDGRREESDETPK